MAVRNQLPPGQHPNPTARCLIWKHTLFLKRYITFTILLGLHGQCASSGRDSASKTCLFHKEIVEADNKREDMWLKMIFKTPFLPNRSHINTARLTRLALSRKASSAPRHKNKCLKKNGTQSRLLRKRQHWEHIVSGTRSSRSPLITRHSHLCPNANQQRYPVHHRCQLQPQVLTALVAACPWLICWYHKHDYTIDAFFFGTHMTTIVPSKRLASNEQTASQ